MKNSFDDYLLLKRIIEYLGDVNPFFNCYEVIRLIKDKPNWLNINKHVMRKGDT
jgi:spore coat polysaccharide biosynthesis protein SpsF